MRGNTTVLALQLGRACVLPASLEQYVSSLFSTESPMHACISPWPHGYMWGHVFFSPTSTGSVQLGVVWGSLNAVSTASQCQTWLTVLCHRSQVEISLPSVRWEAPLHFSGACQSRRLERSCARPSCVSLQRCLLCASGVLQPQRPPNAYACTIWQATSTPHRGRSRCACITG